MKTVKQWIVTAAFCSAVAFPVYAKDDSKGINDRLERKEKITQQIYAQLSLSEDQKKQLEANKHKQRDGMKASYEQMKSQREALHQELMKADIDMNKVRNIHAKLKSFQAQMMDERLNSILEVRKILTPEQFSQFISLMQEHKSKFWSKESKNE